MYFIGLDLGQLNDYTAVTVIDVADRQEDRKTYDVTHLQRFPLGTPYPLIVEKVIKLRDKLNGHEEHPINRCVLVVDATGVGRPVVDLFRMAGLGPVAVTITGGSEAHIGNTHIWASSSDKAAPQRAALEWSVPKKDLVGVLNVLFQNRLLKIAKIPEAGTLTQELMNFKIKINTQTLHESFEAWREGIHDDLVLAVALAVYAATRGSGPRIPIDQAKSGVVAPDVFRGEAGRTDPFGRERKYGGGTPLDGGLPRM